MKSFSIRLIIGLFTFLIGINVTVFWMFYGDAPKVEISDMESQNNVETVITKSDPVAEQYAVYSVLINEYEINKYESKEVLMINNRTSVGNFNDLVPKLSGLNPEKTFQNYDLVIPPEFQSALKDYKSKNKEPEQLTSSFNIKAGYKLVNKKQVKLSAEKITYFTFSGVGFDSKMEHAFVYVEYFCSNLCADGSYRLLTKEDGVWKETKRLSFWAS
jgi:hypothetical protein